MTRRVEEWGEAGRVRDAAARWFAPIVLVTMFAGWEAAGRAGLVSPIFFPVPSRIAAALVRKIGDGTLAGHVTATLARMLAGGLAGGAAGLLLGLLMGASTRVRRALDPLVALAHPMPKISLLPLLVLIFGIGELPRSLVVGLAAFFPMLLNTMAGIMQIPPVFFEVAHVYGSSPWQVFRSVLIPGSLPMILTGMRLSLNLALTLTIAVELVTARRGLGSLIWWSWETMRVTDLYAGLVTIAFLGLAFNAIGVVLRRWLVPWQPVGRPEA